MVPECWEDRLGSMEVVDIKQKMTTLEGCLPDQAALKGVLDTLYQLHLPLLELTCLKHNMYPQKMNHVRGGRKVIFCKTLIGSPVRKRIL